MRHAGIVPLLRVMHLLHAEGRVRPGRGREARRARRDVPAILDGTVDGDRHGLARLVDHDENGRARLSGRAAEKRKCGQQDNEKAETLHDSPRWLPHAARARPRRQSSPDWGGNKGGLDGANRSNYGRNFAIYGACWRSNWRLTLACQVARTGLGSSSCSGTRGRGSITRFLGKDTITSVPWRSRLLSSKVPS